MTSVQAFVLVAFGLALVLQRIVRHLRRQKQLPPGPRGWPLIGNFKDTASAHLKTWEHFYTFKDMYGPVSSITTMGNTMIIINTLEAAENILEKNSAVTAGRPKSVVAGDMLGWDRIVAFKTDAQEVRTHRKYLTQHIGSNSAIKSFSPILQSEAQRVLLRLLQRPEDFLHHIRRQAGAQILRIVYGYNVESKGQDRLVDLVEKAMGPVFDAALPGKYLPDALPILKYVPAWTPGARIQKLSKEYRAILGAVADIPYTFVKSRVASGTYDQSYVSKHLVGTSLDHGTEEIIKWTAGVLYLGGADTTLSVLTNFFLNMANNREVQDRAQEEIDRVIGRNRLPNIGDRDYLPYVKAVITEALRWHPVTPTVTPHEATEDFSYQNYVIPKGAALVSNVWAMTHDSEYYRDPMSFDPQRFLEKRSTPEPDPRKVVFGFGRRVCPGRFFAEDTLFMTVASILSAFSISKPVKDGREVNLDPGFKDSFVSSPLPFELSIRPRHEKSEQLIRAIETESEFLEGDSKDLDFSQLDGIKW